MADLQFQNPLKRILAKLQHNLQRPGKYVYDLSNRVSSIRPTDLSSESRLQLSYLFDYIKDTWCLLKRRFKQLEDTGEVLDGEIDDDLFRVSLRKPNIVSEFLFPIEHASWRGGRFSLTKGRASSVRSGTSGLRLQAAVDTDPDRTLERQCQQDVVNLVQSLIRLRKVPHLDKLVLSNEMLVSPAQGSGTRVKFGLYQTTDGRFRNDAESAWECYRQIVRAVRKSRLVVERPKSFDPKTGMEGHGFLIKI
jgi:hypothetical protein